MTIADDRPEDPETRPETLVAEVASGPEDGAGLAGVRFAVVYKWAIAVGLGLLTVALAGFTVYTVRNVLIQVVIALFIAVSLDPAVRWLIRRGVKRSFAVTAIFLLTLLILALFVWSLVPPLVNQGTQLAGKLPDYVRRLPEESKAYRDIANRYGLTEKLTQYATSLPG